MYRHRINPRHCAHGAVPSFTPTNTALVGLYNDSTTYRLAVWGAGNANAGTAGVSYAYPFKGTLTTLVGSGTTMWTNEGSIAGQLYKDDVASPASPVVVVFSQFLGGYWSDQVPTFILDPGWSFVLVSNTPNTAALFGFFWEQLHALAFPPDRSAYDQLE